MRLPNKRLSGRFISLASTTKRHITPNQFKGTDKKYNSELIRSLGSSLKAVAFVDAGILGWSFDEIGSSEIEVAAGLGLRLDLPIGPIRLEYGYNLTRDQEETAGTLHFAIGNTF